MTLMQERPVTVPEQVVQEQNAEEGPQGRFLRPRRFTTEEYYHLGDLGLFDDERVELLDGEIWTLPAQKTPHSSAIRRAFDVLSELFGEGFDIRQQLPMTLANGTEPEPDVLVVPGHWQDYEDHHPTPSEVSLLAEVSDATLFKDRGKKAKTYAQAGIKDYWIINLVNRQLEVYRDPAAMPNGYGYKTTLILFDSDSIAPLSAPNSRVAVAALFPPVTTP